MKKGSVVAIGLLMAVLSSCASDRSGGSGGLFSAGSAGSPKLVGWDMMLIQQSGPCGNGFSGRGASVDPSFPGGYFPGLRVMNSSGVYSGDVPEVKSLAYGYLPPIPAGAEVSIHFAYSGSLDGDNGDYLLVRAIDGDLFRVAANIHGALDGSWHEVNYSYHSQSTALMIMIVTGISGSTEYVRLDDLKVSVNGVQVMADAFDSGTYTVTGNLGTFLRIPLLPNNGATLLVDTATPFEGAGSLKFLGGSYFSIDGMGGSADGMSAISLSLYDLNMLAPYYGQIQAVKQDSTWIGTYSSWNDLANNTCPESGQAVISIEPEGNADLSGAWNMSVRAQCAEAGLGISNFDGTPAAFGSAVFVRQLLFYNSGSFTTPFMNTIDPVTALALGNVVFVIIESAGTQAMVMGAYSEGMVVGQITGTLPLGAATCTITAGQFSAAITPVAAPPP